MRTKDYLILICLAFYFISCMDKSVDTRDITMKNNTKKDVYVFLSDIDSIGSFYLSYDEYRLDQDFILRSGFTGKVYDKPDDWESYIAQAYDGVVRIFIVSSDSVHKYGWTKIFNNNIYTKMYQLDIDDLNKCKWTIVYSDK